MAAVVMWSRHPKISAAVAAMRSGELVAYPTEAVWGLGCDPWNAAAVARLLTLKERPVEKGLILVAAHPAQLGFLIDDLSTQQQALLEATWPGPVSWLIPHHQRVPPWICGRHASVAVRVSAHPTVQALCQRFGGPVVSSSANRQACPPARFQFQVRRHLGSDLLCLPGRVDLAARPSQIRDLLTGAVLRV